MYTFPIERDTETMVDNILRNLGWSDDPKNPIRNVYKQQPKTMKHKKLLGGLKPDYLLYRTSSDTPLIVIETKKPKKNIHQALEQGLGYAKRVDAPIVFATDGVFTKTIHSLTGKPLFLNGNEIDEFIREALALQFLKDNEVITTTKKVIESRKELISIFYEANDLLRAEGLQAGIDRFAEFSNLLFLKIISEREEIAEENGEKNLIAKEYRWDYFKGKDGVELRNYINDTVLKYFKEKFDDRTIFQDIRIQNPTRIKRIIDMLEPLQLIDTNADVKGDAFEYFLRSYSSGNNNDLGQYFTPRHIVKTMVKLLDPKLGEKVYDPFCGTGGMLTETFKHIQRNMPQNKNSNDILKHNTVFGKEITNIARIAKMNMILIGDGHSNIEQKDSLEIPVKNEYDVVITNIPFSQTTEHGNLYDIPTENGNSICVQHCLKALNKLNTNSRAGIIVPEGFLFDSVYKTERKYLLDKYDLHTIVSLPAGAFLPNTIQKTDILYVKNRTQEKKDKIWIFNVQSDGFTLDNYRKPVKTNDLDNLLDGINFESLSLNKISSNYELVKTMYDKKGILSGKYERVLLKNISKVMFGNSAPQDLDLFENGIYPFFRVSDLAREHIAFNLTYATDKLNKKGIKGLTLFPKGTILFPKSGLSSKLNHRGILGCDGYAVSHFACIIPDTEQVDPYYLLYCLMKIRAQDLMLNEGYPSIRKEVFENIEIPLPSPTKQRELVSEIYKIVELENKVLDLKDILSLKFEKDVL